MQNLFTRAIEAHQSATHEANQQRETERHERARRRMAFAESNRPAVSRQREGKLVEVRL